TVTGLPTAIPGLEDKRLQLLKEAVPSASRVAYLGATAPLPSHTEAAARALHVTVVAVETATADSLDKAFGEIKRARADALLAVWGPTFFWSARQRTTTPRAHPGLPPPIWSPSFPNSAGLPPSVPAIP